MLRIALATEDELSEAVGLRLVAEVAPALEVGLRLRRGGYGYLRSRITNFCQMAQREPVLLITDLDNHDCAASLIEDWMRRTPRATGLMFRVAVREIESWLLADHDAVKALFGRNAMKLPDLPDILADPKRAFLSLARSARREVRADLCAQTGAIAAQGLGYNRRLTDFVRRDWNPMRASSRSDSLRRARHRLRELANDVMRGSGRGF
jgi:hypothetical protein